MRKKRGLTAADIVKAMKRLKDSDLWYVPVTVGEAKRMKATFMDHLCRPGRMGCRVCRQANWFSAAWEKRIRVLPGPSGKPL